VLTLARNVVGVFGGLGATLAVFLYICYKDRERQATFTGWLRGWWR
jgi:hypothetical protein